MATAPDSIQRLRFDLGLVVAGRIFVSRSSELLDFAAFASIGSAVLDIADLQALPAACRSCVFRRRTGLLRREGKEAATRALVCGGAGNEPVVALGKLAAARAVHENRIDDGAGLLVSDQDA